jgi:hypothetical protein
MIDFVKPQERISAGFMGAVYRVGGFLALDLAYTLKFAFVGK